jgi:hypothetical protein
VVRNSLNRRIKIKKEKKQGGHNREECQVHKGAHLDLIVDRQVRKEVHLDPIVDRQVHKVDNKDLRADKGLKVDNFTFEIS